MKTSKSTVEANAKILFFLILSIPFVLQSTGCVKHTVMDASMEPVVASKPVAPMQTMERRMAAEAPETVREFNTEEYDRIRENVFKATVQNPLSTLSIDVDTASYSNLRRYIQNDRMPPRDAVRIEEMINYFDYDYPEPAGEHPFSITT